MRGGVKKDGSPMTVEEWNEWRQKQFEEFNHYPKKTNLLCNKCGHYVWDQFHIDHTSGPPRRQTVCGNCNDISYRLMGDDECRTNCPFIVFANTRGNGDVDS